MSDQELFNKDNTSEGSDPTTSSSNPFEDKLKGIKNENGEPKYKDVDSALEALKHSQDFIETLKSEKQKELDEKTRLLSELEKRASVEDVVNKLVKQPNSEDTTKTKVEPAGLDESKVMDLVKQALNQSNQQSQEAKNLSSVVNALTETHGDKAKEVIHARAKELNTDPSQLENLARTNPAMAMELLKVEPKTSSAPIQPSQTSQLQVPKKELEAPTKKLITGGASRQEIMDEWNAIKADVYNKNDVQT